MIPVETLSSMIVAPWSTTRMITIRHVVPVDDQIGVVAVAPIALAAVALMIAVGKPVAAGVTPLLEGKMSFRIEHEWPKMDDAFVIE